MIRLIEDLAELHGEDLTGKYILRKLNYHWFAYGKAAIVVGHDGTLLNLEREEMEYDPEWDRRVYTGHGKRYPGGVCPISAVGCVCDTPDDVNTVIQMNVDAEREFHELIAKTESRLRARARASQSQIYLAAAE